MMALIMVAIVIFVIGATIGRVRRRGGRNSALGAEAHAIGQKDSQQHHTCDEFACDSSHGTQKDHSTQSLHDSLAVPATSNCTHLRFSSIHYFKRVNMNGTFNFPKTICPHLLMSAWKVSQLA